MSKGGTPIKNKHELELVSNYIRKRRECYYIIFNLILETGMPLERIKSYKVQDLKGNKISFIPIHKNVIREEIISLKLQEEIEKYLAGKNDDEPAFTSKDGTKPIYERGFQKALIAASSFYGINPPITSDRLRRTYIYNLFLKRDYDKIINITGCRSQRQIYRYLDMPMPASRNKTRLEHYSQHDALIKEKIISKAKESIMSSLGAIETNLEKDDISLEYIENVMVYANTLIKITEEFEENCLD